MQSSIYFDFSSGGGIGLQYDQHNHTVIICDDTFHQKFSLQSHCWASRYNESTGYQWAPWEHHITIASRTHP
jgi:hypothetical protein